MEEDWRTGDEDIVRDLIEEQTFAALGDCHCPTDNSFGSVINAVVWCCAKGTKMSLDLLGNDQQQLDSLLKSIQQPDS